MLGFRLSYHSGKLANPIESRYSLSSKRSEDKENFKVRCWYLGVTLSVGLGGVYCNCKTYFGCAGYYPGKIIARSGE